MPQKAIPFLFMRGGTSRGPYLQRAHLPEDRNALSQVLVRAVGSGHSLNIDGIGGGAAVTTKVAMLSRSEDEWADVDYFFAQVSVEDGLVDYKPTCGNILSGVGPAALEMGLLDTQDGVTPVRIRAVNIGARIEALVQTPGGVVEYEGSASIDGVPGSAAPIMLNFMDVTGAATGKLLPTGAPIDEFDGIRVSCIDVAMPMVIAQAAAFGLTGYETRDELDANTDFMARMEAIRVQAGERMGMGDVSRSVTPKFGLLSAPRHGGSVNARYFMPRSCHPSMAVTGGQCLAACILHPGTVAEGLASSIEGSPATVTIEHPSGGMDITVDYRSSGSTFELMSAGVMRTARLLVRGELMIPSQDWAD